MSFGRGKCIGIALLASVLAFGTGCAKQPTDSQITQQIQAKLSQDSGLQSKAITVDTAGGVATLSGTVDNDTQRAAAAHYASTVPGIKEVVNNLEVSLPAPPAPATNAEATPPAPVKPAAKPRPSTPRARAKKETPKQDSPDWDAPPADSSSDNSGANGGNQIADATPAPATPAVAPPPPPPPPKNLTVPSGTTIAIRLIDPIDSETAQQGQTFKATLDSPLSVEGEVAVPTGYKVEGHVVDVKSAGKFAGQSLLVLQLNRISVGDKSYNLQTDQYKRQGSNRSTNTAEKVGAGAVIGAIIGGIAGGGKGAGIGAAAGGGVGGGVQAATKGQQIKLPSESVLNFTLTSPLTVTQVQKGPDANRPKLDSPQ
jgi:hypothetical protein